MKLALAGLAVGATALGLALFFFLGSSSTQPPFGRFGPAQEALASVAVRGSLPAPSPQHARRATEVALHDTTVRHLLGTSSWRVAGVETWFVGDGVSFAFRRPRGVDADLPYVVVPPDAPARGQCVHPYARGWWHLQAPAVTRLEAWVDLRPGHVGVVAVDTDAVRGELSPVPGKAHPWCTPSA